MGFRRWLGNQADMLGTTLGLPELGISEKVAGKNTINTNNGAMYFPIGQFDTSNIGKSTPSPYANSPLDAQQQDPGNGGSDGGTTFDQWFNGVHYTDPILYANAVNQAAVEAYNTANKSLQTAYTNGLISFADYEEQLRQNRTTIQNQYKDAMGAVSGRFAAQGANVYQSEQGVKEGKIGEITNQNYENQATQEANLGLQRTGFENEYAALQEQNRNNQQAVIDATMNSLASSLQGTPYANQLSQINAPTINNAPLDNSFMNTYNALGGMKGNAPAIKGAIGASNQPDSIKTWLYQRFNPQTV